MIDIEETKVIVLNKSWKPIGTTLILDAITKVLNKRAKFLSTEDFTTHDLKEWNDYSAKHIYEHSDVVRSVYLTLLVPKAIVITNYDGYKIKKIGLNRHNIFQRDNFICCYCGYKFSETVLTLDHVNPKSKGGETTWENLVTSCFPCNSLKRNRTPEEAGMKLLKKPFQPKILDIPNIDIFTKYLKD